MLLDTVHALSTADDYDACAAIAFEACDDYDDFCTLMDCLLLSLYWDFLAACDRV